jgi:hypothetical protein
MTAVGGLGVGLGRDGGAHFADQFGELVVGELQDSLLVPDAVGVRVGAGAVEVGVELRMQGRHRGGESVAVVVEAHRLAGAGVEDGPVPAKAVVALDRSAYALLAPLPAVASYLPAVATLRPRWQLTLHSLLCKVHSKL